MREATRRPALTKRRKAVGHTQESLAELLGIDRSTIVRWESGVTEPTPHYRPKIADALGLTSGELDRILTEPPELRGLTEAPRAVAAYTTRRVASGSAALVFSGDASVTHAAAMESFRLADRRVGGGHLYDAVVAYLNGSLARDLLAVAEIEGTSPFTVAAALSEMAGWMAHDAGNDPLAARHFTRAISLAAVDGDVQVTAHVLGSAAHLALLQADPDRAGVLAARGLETARNAGTPGLLRARLLGMRARAAAARGDRRAALNALHLAEIEVGRLGANPLSTWVSKFDEASLAMDSARAFLTLGDVRSAHEQAERVIASRPADRPRSRALGQLMLARSKLLSDRPEHAATLAQEVLNTTAHLGSGVVVTELEALGRSMAEPDRGEVARGVAQQIEQEMKLRLGFAASLTHD